MPDHDQALILSDTDLKPLLDDPAGIDGAIDVVERTTLVFHEGRVREGNLEDRTAGEGPVNVMQIHLAAADGLVTGYQMFAEDASGDRETLPNARFVTLLHPETRQLQALVPYIGLSPVRVGATAGVACRYLAPEGATSAAIIGSSKQARRQLQAIVRAVPSVRSATVFSPTPANREAFAREMSAWLGITVEPAVSVQQAVAGADIVDLANNSKQPLLDMAWVKPGALVMPVGGNQLLPSVLDGGCRIVTTTWAQMARGREPYGTAIREGRFTRDQTVGELAEVILGQVTARRSPDETVVYELGRINIWAVAVCHWAYQWAQQRGAGTPFSLV